MPELIYEKKMLVRSEQVDMTRRMRVSELFRIMEEASIAHTEELGCTREKTLDKGLLWVIARQTAEIEDLPVYDEEITLRSWQGETMHVFFPRFYEVMRGDRCIVRGRAMWTLIDEKSREIIMPEDYDISIPAKPGSEEMYLAAVIKPKWAGQPDAEEHLVTRFSQIDINGHMNNTRYFDIVDDINGAEFCCANMPRMVSANYVSELVAGEEFDLSCYVNGQDRYYEGRGTKQKFRIMISY
ncbi:MAG: hypothetical protein E7220_06655 [Clostridiales bacterium]|nr:hypothetical protein [Clostridiales bacterium]